MIKIKFKEVKSLTICAHARYITSIDIMGDKLVSAGEDCFFRVWEFSEVNGKLKVANCLNNKKL